MSPPPAPGPPLSAARRSRELAETVGAPAVDVLVVGLGATGAGAALDAAARGLSVAAVDAHDLAVGTSRWSSKLIHGGLRYLASGQLDVAQESAVERGVLMERTAPHLGRAQPFVLPLTPLVSRGQAALAWAGFRAGDTLRLPARTARATLPAPRRPSAVENRHLATALRTTGLRGGLPPWARTHYASPPPAPPRPPRTARGDAPRIRRPAPAPPRPGHRRLRDHRQDP